MIFREGTEGHFYYQVISGSVRWVNITDDGREFIQHMSGPGELWWITPFWWCRVCGISHNPTKRPWSCVSQKATFRQLLREDPELHFAFSKLMAQRMRFKFLLLKRTGLRQSWASYRYPILLLQRIKQIHLPKLQPGATHTATDRRHDGLESRNRDQGDQTFAA